MILIELCAGSAALSLRWLGQEPPLGWQGGKRSFAAAILRAVGLASQGGLREEGQVVLCEPGPWGEAWALWRVRGTAGTCARLLELSTRDPTDLWHELAEAPIPRTIEERVAVWCVLQFWSYGSKPVIVGESRWRTHGFHAEGPYRREVAARKRAEGRPSYRTGRDQRLPLLVKRLQGLDLSRIRAVHRQLADVPIEPGAVTYIDPPYAGTTCPYGFELPREQVLKLAQVRAAGGELVLLSEAEALQLPGWVSVQLPAPRDRGRNNFTAQREEWLTVCPALAHTMRAAPKALSLPGF